jgi:hypothetical protein
MSPAKLISFRSPRHRPYTAPTLTKMTGEQAQAVLGVKAIPGDVKGARLLQAIKAGRQNHGKHSQPWAN